MAGVEVVVGAAVEQVAAGGPAGDPVVEEDQALGEAAAEALRFTRLGELPGPPADLGWDGTVGNEERVALRGGGWASDGS